MIYGLYQSAAGMMTTEYRQDVLANNIANADTIGFKRDLAVFAERYQASQSGQRSGPSNDLLRNLSGGVWLGQTYTDFDEGAYQETGNPLDVALAGSGFLMVRGDESPLLTRDGRMMLDPDGALVATTDAAPVLSESGTAIRVNPHGGKVTIDEDGFVNQDGARRGRLAVVDVDNYDALRKVGASRFDFGSQKPVAAAAQVMSERVENSGVEPVKELVGMIEASRAYQLNAQMVSLQDQSVGRLISAVALR